MNITIVMIITGNFHFLCITYENDFYNKYIFLLLITEKNTHRYSKRNNSRRKNVKMLHGRD